MKSWKTTLTGVLAFLGIASQQLVYLVDADPGTNPEWNLVIGGLMTLIMGFTARDNDVSSESAGAN